MKNTVKVGFTCSTFDLLHSGHIAMLREAKEQCDYLIAGLQIDPSLDRKEKNSPAQTIVERYVQLSLTHNGVQDFHWKLILCGMLVSQCVEVICEIIDHYRSGVELFSFVGWDIKDVLG